MREGIVTGLSVAFYIMYPKKLFARWGSFAVTGIGIFIGGIVATALYLRGVSVAGSVQGGLLGAVEPVSATLHVTLWLGTAFTGADLAGCALMIAMIFLVAGEKSNVRQDGAQAVEDPMEEVDR